MFEPVSWILTKSALEVEKKGDHKELELLSIAAGPSLSVPVTGTAENAAKRSALTRMTY